MFQTIKFYPKLIKTIQYATMEEFNVE